MCLHFNILELCKNNRRDHEKSEVVWIFLGETVYAKTVSWLSRFRVFFYIQSSTYWYLNSLCFLMYSGPTMWLWFPRATYYYLLCGFHKLQPQLSPCCDRRGSPWLLSLPDPALRTCQCQCCSLGKETIPKHIKLKDSDKKMPCLTKWHLTVGQ